MHRYRWETIKVLELFSGTECISNAFRARGHECYTVDWDEQFPSSWHTDISKITAKDILERFGKPDIIWCGTDCTSYSVAAMKLGRNFIGIEKNKEWFEIANKRLNEAKNGL